MLSHWESQYAALENAVVQGYTKEKLKTHFGLGDSFVTAIFKLTPTAAAAWRDERHKKFSVTERVRHGDGPLPRNRGQDHIAEDWMMVPSWTFCPLCGRRQPSIHMQTKLENNSTASVSQNCDLGCDCLPEVLEDAIPDDQDPPKGKKLLAYVTPQEEF